MKDYRIEVKIKNNLLYRAMMENGVYTANELSRLTGVTNGTIGLYLSLKTVPLDRYGNWKKSYLKVCDYLKRLPDDLYPKQHLARPLLKNKSSMEASFEEVMVFLPPSKDPHEMFLLEDRKGLVREALSNLTPRQAKILTMRFGLDGGEPLNSREIGEMEGVSGVRIDQLSRKALKKLRHSVHEKKLREYL